MAPPWGDPASHHGRTVRNAPWLRIVDRRLDVTHVLPRRGATHCDTMVAVGRPCAAGAGRPNHRPSDVRGIVRERGACASRCDVNVLPRNLRLRCLAALVDGVGIRATARMVGEGAGRSIHRDTIGRLQFDVGQGCAILHDRLFVDLRCPVIELDEIWSFCRMKQKRVPDGYEGEDRGDVWTFKALDVASRAVISHVSGKRTAENAAALALDLRRRVMGRPSIASDGYKPYVGAIEEAFGADVDFGMLVKQYEGDERTGERNGHYKGAIQVPVMGRISDKDICTSYIERQNLTQRHQVSRMNRKKLNFSKNIDRHRAALDLNVAHYNLCCVHKTLRVTPAMALGVTDHVWTLEELMDAALALLEEGPAAPPAPAPPPPPPAPRGQLPLAGMPRLILLQGGKK